MTQKRHCDRCGEEIPIGMVYFNRSVVQLRDRYINGKRERLLVGDGKGKEIKHDYCEKCFTAKTK